MLRFQLRSAFGLLLALLCRVLATPVDLELPELATSEVIYQFLPTMLPENTILRPNGQMLVTCLTCATISQLDPNLGPTQERRTVFTFPAGVINVLGIVELSKDKYAVAVAQVNPTSAEVSGPPAVWTVDLTQYQAPTYDSSKVKAEQVAPGSTALLFDGLAIINTRKGLLAATDFGEGKIWLVDIQKHTTTVLIDSPLLKESSSASNLTSLLSLANGLKIKGNRLYFTSSTAGNYGYVPVDLSTGKATADPTIIYEYGLSLDDFNFGPTTGDTYFTTFAKPNGGIIRRPANTPNGQDGSKMILLKFGTNSIIPRNTANGECQLLFTVFLEAQIARATIPGPC